MDWTQVIAIILPLLANIREVHALRKDFAAWSSKTTERVENLEKRVDELERAA